MGGELYSARVFVREADIRLAFRISVRHGVLDNRRYTCDPVKGCPAKPTEMRQVPQPPGPTNIVIGGQNTTVNTGVAVDAGGAGAPAAAPAE